MRRLGSLSGRRLALLMLVTSVLGTLVATAAFAWFQGYRLYVVETGSMSPAFAAGDVVIDRPVRTGYRPGDVLTVQISAAGDLVTHRMTHRDELGRLHTKGDANEKPDAWGLRPEQVRGVVRASVPNLGYLVVFMRQPEGVAGVMTSALSLFLLWGLCFPASTKPVPTTGQQAKGTRLWIPRQRAESPPAAGAGTAPTPVGAPVRELVSTPAQAGDAGKHERLVAALWSPSK